MIVPLVNYTPLADCPELETRSCYDVAFPVESQERTFCGEVDEGNLNVAGLFKIGNPNISDDAKNEFYTKIVIIRHAKATGKRDLGEMRGVER